MAPVSDSAASATTYFRITTPEREAELHERLRYPRVPGLQGGPRPIAKLGCGRNGSRRPGTRSLGEEPCHVGEGLDLDRVARGVEEEQGGLLSRLSLEADVRLDQESDALRPQPARQRLPIGHRQHDAEVAHGHAVIIHGVSL